MKVAIKTSGYNTVKYTKGKFSNKQLLEFYRAILKPRMIEEKMLLLLRQGKISKWFAGIGQEAIATGAAMALKKEEFILPMHRNLGVFTTREIPLNRLFSQFQGKPSGFTKGRDRSFHFGAPEYNIVGMISHLGPQLGVADGIALAEKLDNNGRVSLVFCGDGGASQGDFHEALNVAAVWELPVIFIIEHNGYGLSTPNSEQFKFESFTQKGVGYGMDTEQVDGNNILDVYRCIDKWSKSIRKNPRPVLIEAMTFRMRGHEEASGTKYVPKDLLAYWEKRDPVKNYEDYLLTEGILDEEIRETFREEISSEIEDGLKQAFDEALPQADTERESNDLYAEGPSPVTSTSDKTEEMRFVDAVSKALDESMERYPELVLMGQDIADYGGVFKVTDGLMAKYGKDRVRNTPLCESAILGMSLGMSVRGKKSMVEMQFADFVSVGFNQIVNNLAKVHYRWGQNADVVVRMPTGAGVGAGPFHSQSNEAWFFHVPGLKILYPSNSADARGLLNAAFADPNPCLFFEHKYLYRSHSSELPVEYTSTEIGKANVTKEGSDLCIITYGMGVHWALKAQDEFSEIDIEIIDLRSLLPWDKETVRTSVEKCNKVLVLHEDTLTGGIGGEISAWISEHCFKSLDAPVVRVGSLDTPVPFSTELEADFLPYARLIDKIQYLAEF